MPLLRAMGSRSLRRAVPSGHPGSNNARSSAGRVQRGGSATGAAPPLQSDPPPQPAAPAIAPAAASVPPTVPEPMPVPVAPPHPLTIAALRAGDYPGSDLAVEQTLAPGSNYNQQIVSYRSEGLKIFALLTALRGSPPAAGWPVVVFNHGYIPPAHYRTTERYVAYVDAFARSGYFVLKPDYRAHGSSEGQTRSGYGTPDYVVDVLIALSAVRRWPEADASRVGMWGHSMGGYITLRAMVASGAVELYVYQGDVHNISANVSPTLARSVAFFDAHIKRS